MNFIDVLTPKDTEEVKPGLFIQQRGRGYRMVQPFAWNGKMRWREQMRTVFSIRTFITLAIIGFIVWGYLNDTGEFRDFYVEVKGNPVAYCQQFLNPTSLGLSSVNLSLIKDGETSDTLFSNP